MPKANRKYVNPRDLNIEARQAFDEDEEDADMIDIVDKLDFNGKDISADDVVQLGVSAREEWLRKGLGLGPDVSEEEIEK